MYGRVCIHKRSIQHMTGGCVPANRHSQVFPWYGAAKIRSQVSVWFSPALICVCVCVCGPVSKSVSLWLVVQTYSCVFVKGTYGTSRWNERKLDLVYWSKVKIKCILTSGLNDAVVRVILMAAQHYIHNNGHAVTLTDAIIDGSIKIWKLKCGICPFLSTWVRSWQSK